MSIAPPDPHEPITAEMWAQIRAAYPNAERLATAWSLAPDVETLADLLAGRPVAPERLDQDALFAARRRRLVTLTPALAELPQVANG